jgi:hypothetical protein
MVTHFHWHEPSNPRLTSSLVDSSLSWFHFRRDYDFLPRAMSFFASCNTAEGTNLVVLWLSTTLTSLTMVLRSCVGAEAIIALLSAIRTRSPYLASLSIQWDSHLTGPQDRQIVRGALQAFLQARPHTLAHPLPAFPICLRSLALPLDLVAPSVTLWHAIGNLQNLEDLALLTETSRAWRPRMWHSREEIVGGSFPALKTLRISASMKEATEIVLATTQRLTGLHLSILQLDSESEFRSRMCEIARFCPGLTHFTLLISDSSHVLEETSWFDPLLSLRDLEHITIRSPMPLSLTDNDINEMLSSWLHIRHLSLNPMPDPDVLRSYEGPLPTMNTIIFAAESGVSLQYLGLCLDTRVRPRRARRTWDSLRYLDLGTSAGSDDPSADDVAEILHSTFPLHDGQECLRMVTTGRSWWVQAVATRLQVLRDTA